MKKKVANAKPVIPSNLIWRSRESSPSLPSRNNAQVFSSAREAESQQVVGRRRSSCQQISHYTVSTVYKKGGERGARHTAAVKGKSKVSPPPRQKKTGSSCENSAKVINFKFFVGGDFNAWRLELWN